MKYSFNHAGPYVEIPALDSFFHELRNICKKFNIGYRLEQSSDGFAFLNLVPAERCDWDMFIDNLADYESGVPFLDEAKARWQLAVTRLEAQEAVRREERKQKAAEQDHQRLMRQEAGLREHGLTLSDGKYRLVKEENLGEQDDTGAA